MPEIIFVHSCSLHDGNFLRVSDDLRKWFPQDSIYARSHPARLIVCRGSIATVINEGDVFSFVRRKDGSGTYRNEIINHSEKRDSVYVSIENNHFFIETFVAKIVGGTENMKFRLVCLSDPDLSMDFDDYASLSNKLNEYLWDAVDLRLLKI
mgnify:CR=1 FL=1